MENHQQFSDTDFEQQFANGEFKATDFSHEAHLRLAYVHISRYGAAQAEENIQYQLQNFVSSLGAQDKYHTTLTVSAVKVVYHFMQKAESTTFSDFVLEFPRLKSNFTDLLASHYGFDLFKSDQAKREYMKPDLLPFT